LQAKAEAKQAGQALEKAQQEALRAEESAGQVAADDLRRLEQDLEEARQALLREQHESVATIAELKVGLENPPTLSVSDGGSQSGGSLLPCCRVDWGTFEMGVYHMRGLKCWKCPLALQGGLGNLWNGSVPSEGFEMSEVSTSVAGWIGEPLKWECTI
jgi:hypothetical protein